MEITSITRKVSGTNYDNISVSANLSADDNPIEKAKELDQLANQMLEEIEKRKEAKYEHEREKESTIDLLGRAIEYAKKSELPF